MSYEDQIVHMENGVLHSDSPKGKIDSIVKGAFSSGNDGPLIIHFHGGLNNFETAKGIAQRLSPVYEEAGGNPMFFAWESGLFETVENNLIEISKEKIFGLVWKRVRRIIERKTLQVIGGRDIGDLPNLETNDVDIEIDNAIRADNVSGLSKKQFQYDATLTELSFEERLLLETELQLDIELVMEAEQISFGLKAPDIVEMELNSRSFNTVKGSERTLMDPLALDKFTERPASGSRGIVSSAKLVKAIVGVAARVISRYLKNRDHGLHATIIEEILRTLYLANVGGYIWKTMKKDTADSFGSNPLAHGGTAVLDSIKTFSSSGEERDITLIGHSAGAIYASEFIKAADSYLDDNIKFKIILLAPAVTFKLMDEVFDKHRSRISDFRMFTMTDENEKKDVLVKYLYPHSLLYFVSGVTESEVDMPLLGMERYFDETLFSSSKFSSVKRVRDLISSDFQNGVIWSESLGNSAGLNTGSRTHGDFDNEEKTLESVSHIIKNGFA
ncbi:MAG: hypothetical protein ACJAYN_000799 [Bermanella sp.]|jgi:hypothetical protein